MTQLSFDALERRLAKLSKLNDSLDRVDKIVDWEIFRPTLNDAIRQVRGRSKNKSGRPPFDPVFMFKILFLQRFNNMSDDTTEYRVHDSYHMSKFLGVSVDDRLPDAKTIWAFRNALVKAGVIKDLFDRFNEIINSAGLIQREGTIIDGTFIKAPRQRNTKAENETIKQGEVPEEWEKEENKNKLAQKDTDARWTKKNNETHYGYKNHVSVDKETKLITNYATTPANVHVSQEIIRPYNRRR